VIDPQKPIIQAVYDALNGLALPVYVTLPLGVDQYVLISQPTLTPGSGSAACMAWDATLLLSVYTKFERGNANVEPALDVSAEIMSRLVNQRLTLTGFSMSPIEVQRLSLPQRYDDLNVYVQDNLRLRFTVYADVLAVTPTLPSYGLTLSDSTPEGGSVSFATTSGCSLSFNEVPNASGPPFDTVFIQGGAYSFATLTTEYLNQPFAFFDANGTRYGKDLAGNALVFIDGTVLI
jgi:hypothetical protein